MDQETNLQKWRTSRRKLLRLMGAVGAVAVSTALAPGLLTKAAASTSEEDAKPGRLRRWAMVIDLRRCDGCQGIGKPPQCTTACIQGRFLPEPMEWIEVYEHDLPAGGTYFLPTLCMQCQNPPCVNVCPVGATWSTPEGHVLIDQNRCIGCRMCMAACPYERRFFTWGEPAVPAQSLFVEYSPEHQLPMKRGVVYKCDFCAEMLRAGRLPFCAQACHSKALYFGDLEEDLATNGEDVVQLSTFIAEQNTFRYKEDLGTRPRVYYIPGHGEDVDRLPDTRGRMQAEWNWKDLMKGSKTWKRSGR